MAPNIRMSVRVSVGVRITVLINLSLRRISYFFSNVSIHFLNFFVVTMAAILEIPSRVYLLHRIDAQPEVRLRVGAFDVGVLLFLAAAIFLASVHGKCLCYTKDVDVVFTKKNSSLLTLERGR